MRRRGESSFNYGTRTELLRPTSSKVTGAGTSGGMAGTVPRLRLSNYLLDASKLAGIDLGGIR
jgi:hypothetical protein